MGWAIGIGAALLFWVLLHFMYRGDWARIHRRGQQMERKSGPMRETNPDWFPGHGH